MNYKEFNEIWQHGSMKFNYAFFVQVSPRNAYPLTFCFLLNVRTQHLIGWYCHGHFVQKVIESSFSVLLSQYSTLLYIYMDSKHVLQFNHQSGPELSSPFPLDGLLTLPPIQIQTRGFHMKYSTSHSGLSKEIIY